MIEKLEQPAIDFLLYDYFGITSGDNPDEMILKCAQRAYRDLCRTLKFTERVDKKKGKEKKQIEEKHLEFRDDICGEIKKQVNGLLAAEATNFDKKHNAACKAIIGIVTKTEQVTEFNYGQAQKWLNMTMKYMWLLGLRQNDFARLLSVLHIPVDSYILQAVWEQDKEHDVALPLNKGKKRENEDKYSDGKDGKVVAWSQWNYTQYNDFQTNLRNWCKKYKKATPLKWEGSAWIEIAQERK